MAKKDKIAAAPFMEFVERMVARNEANYSHSDYDKDQLTPQKQAAHALGISERALYRYRYGFDTNNERTDVFSLDRVDEMLRNAGYFLWDVYATKGLEAFCAECAERVETLDDGRCAGCLTQTGVADEGDARTRNYPLLACSEEVLSEARRLYVAGAMMPAIAARLFDRTSYKNVESFRRCLYDNFQARGWRTRGKNGAHLVKHGMARRKLRHEPGYRAEYQRRWKAQHAPPRCTCTTRKGTRCTYRVLEGKDVCHIHDEEAGAKYRTFLARGRETQRLAA